jgi:hypothetical protein
MSPVIVVFMVTPIGQRHARCRRTVALTVLTASVGSFAWLLFLLPVYLGFALSVGSAIGWCVWIEHASRALSREQFDSNYSLIRA